jgi:hypothetical protein
MKKIKIILVISLVVFLSGVLAVEAQEYDSAIDLKDCLYYAPGDLATSAAIMNKSEIEGGEVLLMPGDKLDLKIFVKNGGKVIVPDAKILVRIEKTGTSMTLDGQEGKTDKKIVDEFFYPQNVALKPGDSKWLNSQWTIPSKTESGSYTVKVFGLRDKNINLELPSFASSEASAELNSVSLFGITNNESGSLILNGQPVKINGNTYDGNGVDLTNNDDVRITQNLKNNFAGSQNAAVEYKLYQGNYFSESNLVDSSSENLVLDPQKTAEIVYTTDKGKMKTDSLFPYYLRTKISYGGYSLISTLLVSGSVEDIIGLNYISFLKKFPIKKGEEAEIITCLNHSGNVGNAKIGFNVKDANGKEIANQELSLGSQSDLNIPLAFTFPARDDYNRLSIETHVIKDNKVQDVYAVAYDAQVLGLAEAKSANAPATGKIIVVIAIILIVLIIIGAIILIIRGKKLTGGKMAGFFGILFILTVLTFLPKSAQAADYNFNVMASTLGAFAIDSTGQGVDCGVPDFVGPMNLAISYSLRATGAISTNSSGLTMNTTTNNIINFQIRDGTNWTTNHSSWHDTYQSGSARGTLQGIAGFSYTTGAGRTNQLAGVVGIGTRSSPFGIVVGAGVMGTYIWPQYFAAFPSGSPISSQSECSSFSVDSCKDKCCEEANCTNMAFCKQWNLLNSCIGSGNLWNFKYENCVTKCQNAETICNNIAGNGSSLTGSALGNLNDFLHWNDSIGIQSSDNSVLSCDSIGNPRCTALKPGTVSVTVTLQGRPYVVGERIMYQIGTGSMAHCTSTRGTVWGHGVLRTQAPSFTVIVQGGVCTCTTPTCTAATCGQTLLGGHSGTCTAAQIAACQTSNDITCPPCTSCTCTTPTCTAATCGQTLLGGHSGTCTAAQIAACQTSNDITCPPCVVPPVCNNNACDPGHWKEVKP